MALIDEYKQAIQDVLDGRAKPAPRPSELPWTEDKAATMWAAAAAELIAEASGSSGGGVLVVGITSDGSSYIANKTAAEIYAAMKTGAVVFSDTDYDEVYVCVHTYIDSDAYYFQCGSLEFSAQTGADYPTASIG